MSGYHQFCGLAVALDTVGDRWNLLIVRELLIAPRRFSELRSALPGIASNLLTARLRDLEETGIVAREHDPVRKAVGYSLTPAGHGLREAVHALIRWGAQFMAQGPKPGDIVRGEWVQLAATALLDDTTVTEVTMESNERGRIDLTLRTGDTAADPVRVVGDPAAVLGTVAGALPPERARAMGVRIDGGDQLTALLSRR